MVQENQKNIKHTTNAYKLSDMYGFKFYLHSMDLMFMLIYANSELTSNEVTMVTTKQSAAVICDRHITY